MWDDWDVVMAYAAADLCPGNRWLASFVRISSYNLVVDARDVTIYVSECRLVNEKFGRGREG